MCYEQIEWERRVLPQRRLDVQATVLKREAVLYDEAAKRIHSLNVTAKFIWDACDGKSTRGQLLEGMQQEFNGADKKTLVRAVDMTLARLRGEKLVLESDQE